MRSLLNPEAMHKSSSLSALVLFSIVSTLLLSSCTSTTKIQSGNVLYRYTRNNAGQASIERVPISTPQTVKKVEEVGTKLQITFDADPMLTAANTYYITNEDITTRGITDTRTKVFYYLDESADTNVTASEKRSFTYSTLSYGIQSLSVPIKFRNKQRDVTALPASVETSFNLGLSVGMKKTLNVFKNKANFLGKKTTQYSVMPGVGFNLGTADLDPTTNAPGLASKRKLATLSYGGFLMFGINNINFGYAFGFDNALGSGGDKWTYQNQIWHGLIISLDIVKF